MKPPLTIERLDANGNLHIVEVTVSLPAAQRAFNEAVAKNTGEVVRVVDATGALLFSFGPD